MASLRNRIIFASLLLLGLAATLLFLHDNADRSIRALRAGDTEFFLASKYQAGALGAIEKEYNEKVLKVQRAVLEKADAKKNICLKDPSTAGKDPKEQLKSFVEGDCAPLIVIPGLMSTKLQVEIDCSTLLANHPEVMAACGWSTCSWSLIHSRPSTEYLMWIPSLVTPMSFLSFSNATCFGSLISPEYDASQPEIYQKYKDIKGLKINWYGNTPESEGDVDAGFSAVSNLLPLPIQTLGTVAFAGIDTYFTTMGYQKGLNLFAIPYDFRLTHLANSVPYILERTIRYAYELTGKKVVLAGHSLGNLNTLPILARMSQEDKDKMIAAYTSIAAPFGGASKVVRLVMGGDDGFLYLHQMFGMSFFNQKSVIGTASSTFDLSPRDTFYRFRNETWMQDLLARIELEGKYNPNTTEGQAFWKNTTKNDIPYSFFPGPSETCFTGFTDRPKECIVGISDLGKEPIGRVLNTTYYANSSSMQQMFRDHFTMNDIHITEAMSKDAVASGIDNLPNPNVPIVYIYGSHLATEFRHEWDYDPKVNTLQDNFAFPSKTLNKYGDGTVEVSYSLPIAMKWAWENINNKPGSKPVKIAEYCSSFNRKSEVWDTVDLNGTNIMNRTEYIGTDCDCLSSLPGNGADCFHSGMVGDSHIVEMVANVAITKEKVAMKENTAAFRLSGDYLQSLTKSLPHLLKPREDQNVSAWLNPETEESTQKGRIIFW